MIFGTGIDLAKCSRFEKWVKSPNMIERFFNGREIIDNIDIIDNNGREDAKSGGITANRLSALCQHYAARFAAKEAFSKALGTGIVFDLRDVFVVNGASGKPELFVQGSALKAMRQACPDSDRARIFISISHEKEFAVAQVIIEI